MIVPAHRLGNPFAPPCRRPALGLLSVLVSLAMAACGGGGEANPAPPAAASLTLSGTAAVGQPLAGATVSVKCSAGTPASATTTTSGGYTVSVEGGALPCVLRVSAGTAGGTPNTQVLHAWLAGAAGSASAHANLTPLTELMAAHLATGSPAAFFDAANTARFAQITPTAQAAALEAVRNSLPQALRTALGNLDPLTAEFVADGTGLDAVLDQFKAALAAAGLSLDASATRLAAGSPLLPPYLSGPATGTGLAGDTVALTGHALPATPVVHFGTTVAASASTNATGTQLTATVPADLPAGLVALTVEGVVGAVAYTVQVPPSPESVVPTVTALSPASGPAGTVITLTGTGFAAGQVVKFGSTAITPTAVSPTSLTLAVPTGLADGSYQVSVAGVVAATSFALSTPVQPPAQSGYATYPAFYAAAPRAGASTGGNATADAAQWAVGRYWGRGTSSGTACSLAINADGSMTSSLAGNTRSATLSGDKADRWLVAKTNGSFSLTAATGAEYIIISGVGGTFVTTQLSGVAGDLCVPMFKSDTPVDTGVATAPFRITATGFSAADLPASLVGTHTGWGIGKPLAAQAAAPTACTLTIASDGKLTLTNGSVSFSATLDAVDDRSDDSQVSGLQDPGFNSLYSFRADTAVGGTTVEVEVRHTVGRTQVSYAAGQIVGGTGADSGRACYFPN